MKRFVERWTKRRALERGLPQARAFIRALHSALQAHGNVGRDTKPAYTLLMVQEAVQDMVDSMPRRSVKEQKTAEAMKVFVIEFLTELRKEVI